MPHQNRGMHFSKRATRVWPALSDKSALIVCVDSLINLFPLWHECQFRREAARQTALYLQQIRRATATQPAPRQTVSLTNLSRTVPTSQHTPGGNFYKAASPLQGLATLAGKCLKVAKKNESGGRGPAILPLSSRQVKNA